MAYKNQCPSTFRAPFPVGGKETADHQCSNGADCLGNHHCGCGYSWSDIAAASSRKPVAEWSPAERAVVAAAIRTAG